MNMSGSRDDLHPAGMVLSNPGFVIVQTVKMLQQLEVALKRKGRVAVRRMKRRQKDAAAQI